LSFHDLKSQGKVREFNYTCRNPISDTANTGLDVFNVQLIELNQASADVRRIATHLENLEKSGNLRVVREK